MSKDIKQSGNRAPDDGLEVFFEASRDATHRPSTGLMARVMADAAEVADQRALFAGELRKDREQKPGVIARGLAAIGGWPAAAALASVAAVGVWIGAVLPDTVGGLAYGWTDAATEYDYVELLPGFDALGTEG